jgi:uncharacterized protein YxeA
MKTKTLVLVIVVLLILNVVVIICFCHFRSIAFQSVKSAVQQSTEYNSLYNSLAYSILNDGSTINAKIFDKNGEKLSLSTLFTERPGPFLVCRISDRYCDSCVKNAVALFSRVTRNFDQNHIAYFFECDNRMLLKKEIQHFSLDENKVYNVPLFKTDAEYATFPYYMVIDSANHVLATYFPNKKTNELDSAFICKMYNRISQCRSLEKWQEKRHHIDLGDFKYNVRHHHEYDLKSERGMSIEKVMTSCECVSASIDCLEVLSGEFIKVQIDYIAEKQGGFLREIYIWEKGKENPIIIEINGNAY